jgi:uncharacterized integral membrane protein
VITSESDDIALVEARLETFDTMRDWLRRAVLVVFALYVLTSISREWLFHDTHRLPLAIMLVLLGAALMAILLRVLLALARSRQVRHLQVLRSQMLVLESQKLTTKPASPELSRS